MKGLTILLLAFLITCTLGNQREESEWSTALKNLREKYSAIPDEKQFQNSRPISLSEYINSRNEGRKELGKTDDEKVKDSSEENESEVIEKPSSILNPSSTSSDESDSTEDDSKEKLKRDRKSRKKHSDNDDSESSDSSNESNSRASNPMYKLQNIYDRLQERVSNRGGSNNFPPVYGNVPKENLQALKEQLNPSNESNSDESELKLFLENILPASTKDEGTLHVQRKDRSKKNQTSLLDELRQKKRNEDEGSSGSKRKRIYSISDILANKLNSEREKLGEFNSMINIHSVRPKSKNPQDWITNYTMSSSKRIFLDRKWNVTSDLLFIKTQLPDQEDITATLKIKGLLDSVRNNSMVSEKPQIIKPFIIEESNKPAASNSGTGKSLIVDRDNTGLDSTSHLEHVILNSGKDYTNTGAITDVPAKQQGAFAKDIFNALMNSKLASEENAGVENTTSVYEKEQ